MDRLIIRCSSFYKRLTEHWDNLVDISRGLERNPKTLLDSVLALQQKGPSFR
jgi:hypothetical protein